MRGAISARGLSPRTWYRCSMSFLPFFLADCDWLLLRISSLIASYLRFSDPTMRLTEGNEQLDRRTVDSRWLFDGEFPNPYLVDSEIGLCSKYMIEVNKRVVRMY